MNKKDRLKIEEIKKCENNSEENKVKAIFFGIMSVIEVLMREIICVTLKKENVLYLIPFCLIPLFISLYQKNKSDKEISRLKEEMFDTINKKIK